MATETIDVTTLPNGLRVVSETVRHVESVSIGYWIGVGSRDEDPPVRGITHFIEHMLFKGTSRRSAREIASEIESRGGSLNAFTDKEYTCYYAKSLAEDAPLVIDILTDMLRNSLLDPDEIGREKNVVLEEIKRANDTPEDAVHDLFAQTVWNSHPLGRPTLGSVRTVGGLSRETLKQFLSTCYTPDRIVVAAAGNLEHRDIVDLASRHLGDLAGEPMGRRERPARPSGANKALNRRTEQVHFCMGGPAYRQQDTDRYAQTILDMALGGNMSSRLFQEIREKRGLAYSIGSYSSAYTESGLFTIYGGTSPSTFDQVVSLCRAELESVRQESLTEDEIAKAKTQIRGALVLGLESMSARMMRMGKSMLYFDRVIPTDEINAHVQAVTREDVRRIAGVLFDESALTIAAIGPFGRASAKKEPQGT